MFQLPRAVGLSGHSLRLPAPKLVRTPPQTGRGKGKGIGEGAGNKFIETFRKLGTGTACIDVAPSDFASKGFSFRSSLLSPLPFSLSTSGHIFFTFMASILSYHTLVFAVRAKNSDYAHIPCLAIASAHSWLPGSVCASLLATGSGCGCGS